MIFEKTKICCYCISLCLFSSWPTSGIREVGMDSWKNEKLKSFKLENLKLESFCLSWKEPSEVGFFFLKLESFAEVGKFS